MRSVSCRNSSSCGGFAIEKLRRDYDREVKIPSSLVQRGAIARAAGFEAWMKAKEANKTEILSFRLPRTNQVSHNPRASSSQKPWTRVNLKKMVENGIKAVTSIKRAATKVKEKLLDKVSIKQSFTSDMAT